MVPIKPNNFGDVSITVKNNESIDESTKQALDELLQKLNELLSKVPQDKADDASAVAETAKTFVGHATNNNPSKPLVKISAEGLLKAAENIGKVLPAIIPIVKQIIGLLTP